MPKRHRACAAHARGGRAESAFAPISVPTDSASPPIIALIPAVTLVVS